LAVEQISLLITGARPLADEGLRRALTRQYALVEWADSPLAAAELLPRCHFDCIVVQADSASDPAFAWIARLRQDAAADRLILVTGPAGAALADAARRAGANDFLAWPLEVGALRRALNGRARPRAAVPAMGRSPGPGGAGASRGVELVGDSGPIRAVRNIVARVAPTPATVLLEGETGTGKELAARLLHQQSGRRGPFVPVNCGAIAPELMESELFGHSKGAFTGAHQLREGLFLAANGGTLFLDEISAMRRDLQVKLLRVLEEGAIRPVGTDREVPVDARIVASVQPGLAERVADGRFREDLFYRLNVAHIVLPPLRERPDDVEVLARHFMELAAAEFGMPPVQIEEAEICWLCSRPWPGNVRELRNLVERAVLMGEFPGMGPIAAVREPAPGGAYPLDWTLEEVKQEHMRRVLHAHDGNKSAAARKLGVSRKTLERKLGVADSDPGA
jgi:two-component system NtrC family response regulator